MAFEDIVSAYKRLYSRPQIEEALRQALTDRASGVTVTQVNYEGGATVGTINGNTEELITVLNTCLEELDGQAPSSPVAHWDFSGQRLGT